MYVFSAGGTTADKSSRTAEKKILENHLLHFERHMGWESRSGEREFKHMLRSLALEALGIAAFKLHIINITL